MSLQLINASRDPYYGSDVTEYSDPLLANVSDIGMFLGRPRMNLDMSEKPGHYCVCAGNILYIVLHHYLLLIILCYSNFWNVYSIIRSIISFTTTCITTIDLAGFVKDDISINIDNFVLTITAMKKECHAKEVVTFHRRERAFGKVMRSLRLPSNINPDSCSCDFINGVLIVQLPKISSSAHKKLTIA